MKAYELAAETSARLVMPFVHIYERVDYVPSWMHVTRTATVPYLCGPRGLVAVLRAGHHSAKRM